MWEEIKVNGYECSAKVFDKASSTGINSGRIAKLDMVKDGRLVARYDRAWDKLPSTEDEKAALRELLRRFQ